MAVTLVVLFGVSVGYIASCGDPWRSRWTPGFALAVVLGVGTWLLMRQFPGFWGLGPGLLSSTLAGTALGGGAALADHPLAEGLGYWQRVAFGWRHSRLLREHAQRRRSRGAGEPADPPLPLGDET
jgi:hypothetical protein